MIQIRVLLVSSVSNVQTDALYSKLNIGRVFRLWELSNHRFVVVVFSELQQIKPGSVFKVLEVVHS